MSDGQKKKISGRNSAGFFFPLKLQRLYMYFYASPCSQEIAQKGFSALISAHSIANNFPRRIVDNFLNKPTLKRGASEIYI
jgi:hypothetical protein